MIALPIPIEKHACPKADCATLGVILSKSGVNINAKASAVPPELIDENIEYNASPTKSIKNSGIKSFAANSIPLLTPRATSHDVSNPKNKKYGKTDKGSPLWPAAPIMI